MRILLIDTTINYPNFPIFLEPLQQRAEEQGDALLFVDQAVGQKRLTGSRFDEVIFHLLGHRPLVYWTFNHKLHALAKHFRPDLILVVRGQFVSAKVLKSIKAATGAILINYALDDPFNKANNSRDLIDSIPLYDLYACTKRAIISDVINAGCKQAIYMRFGYKPSVHFPERPSTAQEQARFSSDVVFVGGCDADRQPYFEALVQGVPNLDLHLYGRKWASYPRLVPYYRGFVSGRDYRLATSGASIAVNLVRRANRDGHVMRTFEVPACGGFMLAERTQEHLEIFQEDQEIACFSTASELVEKVRYYRSNDAARHRMAEAAHAKVVSGHHTYGDRLKEILAFVGLK